MNQPNPRIINYIHCTHKTPLTRHWKQRGFTKQQYDLQQSEDDKNKADNYYLE